MTLVPVEAVKNIKNVVVNRKGVAKNVPGFESRIRKTRGKIK